MRDEQEGDSGSQDEELVQQFEPELNASDYINADEDLPTCDTYDNNESWRDESLLASPNNPSPPVHCFLGETGRGLPRLYPGPFTVGYHWSRYITTSPKLNAWD